MAFRCHVTVPVSALVFSLFPSPIESSSSFPLCDNGNYPLTPRFPHMVQPTSDSPTMIPPASHVANYPSVS